MDGLHFSMFPDMESYRWWSPAKHRSGNFLAKPVFLYVYLNHGRCD